VKPRFRYRGIWGILDFRSIELSYSAVSHSVKIFKEKMINDKKVKNQFDKINSQFLTPQD